MKFRTKKELLEYLGKNPNDRRLIDRMMIKGEVHLDNRMYVYENKEIVLEERVKELEKEIKNLKENVGNSDELNEAKVQWEYYQNLYENEVKDKQNKIRKCFQWIKQIKPNADWEEFRDWVMND